MTAAEFKGVQYFVKFLRICFWLFRKIGLSDFKFVAIFCSTALLLLGIELLSSFTAVTQYLNITIPIHPRYMQYLTGYAIFSFSFALLYILRLRKMGVISVDSEISAGLDYKAALNRVNDGFDFVGIGASKLTSHQEEFTSALERISSHGSTARLLLCDPRAPIVKRLEEISNVSSGQYLTTVKQSYSFLQHLKSRLGDSLNVRVYKPETEKDLITLRLMFINRNFCLLSQNILGKSSKEGRTNPQLHIDGCPLTGSDPTLYKAFSKLFEQMWTAPSTTAITDTDFTEIAALTSSR